MDKNEAFRRRLEKKKKELLKQDRPTSIQTYGFDATPYVDIIMGKLLDGDEVDDPMLFLEGVPQNPDFDFIFGKSSALKTLQKGKILQELMQRLVRAKDFDPEPYVKELLDLWGTPTFEQYYILHEDGEKDLDLTAYYAKYDWTKEQKRLVYELFLDLQLENARKNRKKIIAPFLISAALVLIPPFLIPNSLQHMGLLPQDSGWFLKIIVGVFSAFVLYFIVKKGFTLVAKFILHRNIAQ